MAQGYRPYLIGNHRYGLELSVQPWLAPMEAYTTLDNCYLRRGVIKKRRGRSILGRIPHAIAAEAVGALGTDNYTGTLAELPIAGSVEFTDGTLTLTDAGDGTFTGDGTGTITYTTGAYNITFSGNTTGAVTVDYNYYPSLAVVGIEPHHDSTAGTAALLAFDTRRAAVYNETTSVFDPIGTTDVFTGAATDIIWGANYQNRLFVTNNNDRVQSYNGTAFSALMMDIDGDAANEVDSCLLVLVYKERLVALRTTEDGTFFPQRARWCAAGDPDDWTNDGYVDCPTNEWIIAADFIKDDLVVFFQYSTWKLRYTGDSELPFRWEKISSQDGGYAPYSGFSYSDNFGVVGDTSINETDGLRVYSIDDKVPDAVAEIDTGQFGIVYSIVSSELRQVLISYPQIGSTANDRSLVYNYDDKAWSRYTYGYNVFGYFKMGQAGTILDNVTDVLDTIDYSWDDAALQAGYPTTVAGDSSGYIWTINVGSSDNGTAISTEIVSGRWSPYLADGRQSRLGWVDLLVTKDPEVEFTVSFYSGHELSAYTSTTITCGEDAPEVGDSKVWVRVDAGAEAEFHRMKIKQSSAGQAFELHAVMAYFKPAGPVM